MGSSEASRLWALVEERIRNRHETKDVDRRIWDEFGVERAVMFTDLSGFSRNVAKFGILHFLQIIFEKQQLLIPVVQHHGGVLVKSEADSMLLIFPSASEAVIAGVEMQRACERVNVGRPEEDRMILCLGIGHGRMLKIGDEDVFGHEVNLASKLGEDTAKGHEILVTPAARSAAGDIEGVTWAEYEVDYAGESRCWRALYR